MRILDKYIKELERELSTGKAAAHTSEVGQVVEVKDGVAILTGLDNAFYGEIISFKGSVQGVVTDLLEDTVGVVVLGDYTGIGAGDQAKGTGEELSLPVGEALLGRVVNPLAKPQDGKGTLKTTKTYPVEKVAPGVVYRQPVDTPLQTGIKAIDALVPIGRGQRELIIGDRGTGKTTLCLDAILNQKNENVVCVYAAIGQKSSKIAAVVELLRKGGALDYTVVVAASASDSAAMQYIAPYSATAIGEYFMDKGKDVLVVYDDLTKHAWAYRQISLILRRPAGREAYPGDVFYLHSRLLERACRMDKKYGGGSLTALPIVEILEGDLSSYIPTNIISITDGQIFLETELFNAGIRPAINVGLSVSRVGGAAQTKAMKKVAGTLKLDLAQYREMAAFSQFESDLDPATKKLLNKGAKMTQLLKQRKHRPYTLSQEVAVLWAAAQGYFDDVELSKVNDVEERILDGLLTRGKTLMASIEKAKEVSANDEEELKKIITNAVAV